MSRSNASRILEFLENPNHTILYKLNEYNEPATYPPKLINKWDENHVRMPCSSLSFYPVNNNGKKSLISRWQVIENHLKNLAKNVDDIKKAILGYNEKFESQWNFDVLHDLFENHLSQDYINEFFSVTYPGIVNLALDLPNLVTKPIPLLKTNRQHSISLSQLQIASLLANAFFCTFPRRNRIDSSSEYRAFPSINFSTLFSNYKNQSFRCNLNKSKIEKLKCILHYFKRVVQQRPIGVVTFSRRIFAGPNQIDWENSDKTFNDIQLQVDMKNSIFTTGIDSIKIDFANKLVGGGALNFGCVQEEILFVTQPELIVSRLFTEIFEDNESMLVQGTEFYCLYNGYSQTFEFNGDFNETESFLSERDNYGRWKNTISMIDALPFNEYDHQFSKDKMLRDLNKAYCGFFDTMPFNDILPNSVSTGNWGCGAFGGDIYLKFILQLIACAQLKKKMIYYTFNNALLADRISDVFKYLQDSQCTVGSLWKCLLKYCQRSRSLQLFDFIKSCDT